MKSTEQTYYSYCLQADLVGALQSVRRTNRNDSIKLKVLRKKVAVRFVDKSESLRLRCDDQFFRDVTELLLTKNPKRFLKKLESEAKNDKGIPHGFTALKILEGLSESSTSKNTKKVAKELLFSNSQKLRSQRARKTRGIL